MNGSDKFLSSHQLFKRKAGAFYSDKGDEQ